MLRSLKEIFGYHLLAEDGEIGKVKDFYFDGKEWSIDYMIADTGPWILGRKVLISVYDLGNADWMSKKFSVPLTKKQIEESPPIEEDKPVSRQYQNRLHQYYNWMPFWYYPVGVRGRQLPPFTSRGYYIPDPVKDDVHVSDDHTRDPNLRSADEVFGYHIHAIDAEVGHLADMLLDDQIWMIRYLIVDLGNILPGKKVLLSPTWVEEINHSQQTIKIDLHKSTIEKSPEFDPNQPVNREYEERIYDYYGRPKYWL